ncbi:MAG: hypothetical protein KJ726_04520 [Verrucomicrobia bacterium]|nr:hypothetical protein [Verrucomicrobiota bacterium]
MTETLDGDEIDGTEEPASWAVIHLPTFLRWGEKLRALPPLPKPLALFLTAVLGILGLLVFITLIAFAVRITGRP